MIGRTNIIFGSGSSSGGSGGVTTVDLPTCPASLTASPANGKVTLTLAYSDTDFVSGVEVRYKTDSYPTSPTDGSGVTAEGAATSIEISGLTNGTTYYFRAYLYREIDGVKYYQTDDTNAKIEGVPTVGVTVSGITPAIKTDNYLVIDTSGSFTMTIPEGATVTAYLVGGGQEGQVGTYSEADNYYCGGNGGNGGYYKSFTLSQTGNLSCSSSIGSTYGYGKQYTSTVLTVGGTNYSTSGGTYRSGGSGSRTGSGSSGSNGLLTPYGYVGSSGGGGASYTSSAKGGSGGSGAGKGGDIITSPRGGNATNYGCGGGGAAPYGGGALGGYAKKGCIIIAWT